MERCTCVRRTLAADEQESATELARRTENPVADLISVPLQNNFNSGSKDVTVLNGYLLALSGSGPVQLTTTE